MQPSSLGRVTVLVLVSFTQVWTGVEAQPGWGWEAQCIGQWLQCGGLNYWGPTNCCEGHQCEYVNDYWWQCNPTEAAPVRPVAPAAPAGPVVTPGSPPPAAVPVSPAATDAPVAPSETPVVVNPPVDAPVEVRPPGAVPVTVPDAPAVVTPPAPDVPATVPPVTTPPVPPAPTVAPTQFPTEAGPPFWEQDCFRVRKNVLSLTPEELADFLEALQALKNNGVYDTITSVHGNPTTFNLFHGNDYFLPWHRWYVLQIENAVRDLGGKFACFSMPYWDWTLDAGRETQSPIWDFFGPMGKKNDSFCMREGPFAEWKNSKGGCLKRVGSDSYRFFSPAEVLDLIMGKTDLVGGFRPAFEAGAHSRPHLFIGGAMNSFASPDDPIFWLHHTFVDKIWSMWQDCHNLLDPFNITETSFKADQIDVELAYAPGVTTRTMWSTRNLGYAYETDIMSAYTFLNTCHWFSLKPNPSLDLDQPSPRMPDPPLADPAVVPVDPATLPAPAQPQKQQVDSSDNYRTKSPKLRGKQAVAAPPKVQQQQQQHLSSAVVLTPAQGGFVATKEWAAAQAAVAPFEPHGKGLIVEENRVFTACMARVQRGEKSATRDECRREVLKRDCEMLGFICDLPETYRDGMHMEADENVFKEGSMCARSCQRRL
ncbi:hypothetical protein VYU27_000301 [Nannochloropsis oceanica]